MQNITLPKIFLLVATASLMSFTTQPAQAQSTGGVLGAIIGGTAGTAVGGNSTQGRVLGAVVGGTLGYVVGDSIDNNNDRDSEYRRRYNGQQGEYYRHNGRSYRRYKNDEYGYVSFPMTDYDNYYHSDRYRNNNAYKGNSNRGKAKFRNSHDNRRGGY